MHFQTSPCRKSTRRTMRQWSAWNFSWRGKSDSLGTRPPGGPSIIMPAPNVTWSAIPKIGAKGRPCRDLQNEVRKPPLRLGATCRKESFRGWANGVQIFSFSRPFIYAIYLCIMVARHYLRCCPLNCLFLAGWSDL
jgi:hypothetical protein